MRIVGGRWRGRALQAPAATDTGIRPSSDRLREALFNILMHAPWMAERGGLPGMAVLDACCGTGALGLEAVSRGAASAVLMDRGPAALRLTTANAASLKAGDAVTVLRADVTKPPPARCACQLLFIDPPYRQGLIPPAVAALDAAGWLAADALVCAEIASDETLELPGWQSLDSRRFGAGTVVLAERHTVSSAS